MRKKYNTLVDLMLPISIIFLPIIMLAVFLFVCIMPGTEAGVFSFTNLFLMLSFPLGLGIILTLLAVLLYRNQTIWGKYVKAIKCQWKKCGIILVGICLIFLSIWTSLLSVFNEGGLNIIRLVLMFGGPILIAMLTFGFLSEMEDSTDYPSL